MFHREQQNKTFRIPQQTASNPSTLRNKAWKMRHQIYSKLLWLQWLNRRIHWFSVFTAVYRENESWGQFLWMRENILEWLSIDQNSVVLLSSNLRLLHWELIRPDIIVVILHERTDAKRLARRKQSTFCLRQNLWVKERRLILLFCEYHFS